MAEHAGLVVGALGCYASEASPPFAPRLTAVGVRPSKLTHAAALHTFDAARESTLPWAPAEELARSAEGFLRKSPLTNGFGAVEVQVVVGGNIPNRVQ